jgi:hypothetical protein
MCACAPVRLLTIGRWIYGKITFTNQKAQAARILNIDDRGFDKLGVPHVGELICGAWLRKVYDLREVETFRKKKALAKLANSSSEASE